MVAKDEDYRHLFHLHSPRNKAKTIQGNRYFVAKAKELTNDYVRITSFDFARKKMKRGILSLFRPPFWDLLMLQLLRPIPRTCHVFTRLLTSNTPWYFLDFAYKRQNKIPNGEKIYHHMIHAIFVFRLFFLHFPHNTGNKNELFRFFWTKSKRRILSLFHSIDQVLKLHQWALAKWSVITSLKGVDEMPKFMITPNKMA